MDSRTYPKHVIDHMDLSSLPPQTPRLWQDSKRSGHRTPLHYSAQRSGTKVVRSYPRRQKSIRKGQFLKLLEIAAGEYHVEALIGEQPCLVARSTVYTSLLTIVNGSLVDLGDGLLQVLMHRSIEDWMADIIAQVERSNQQYIDPRNLCNGIHLELVTQLAARCRTWLSFNLPGLQHTFSRASFVSICTTVTNASFACTRYSAVVSPPNFSIGNGDPNPR